MKDTTKRSKPTQRGNPYQLATNQHVFPKASIERFAGSDGIVECCVVASGHIKKLRPNNTIFCARRVWDQRAEAGATTRQVEDEFQVLATGIETNLLRSLDHASHLTVTKFFALLKIREELRKERPPDVVTRGITGNNLSIDEQERIEKLGAYFFQEDGTLASRMAAGMKIEGQIIWARRNWENWRWGVVRSLGPQFVVPDVIHPLGCVPVGPRTLLAANSPDGYMQPQMAKEYNRHVRTKSENYYFAQDLTQT